MNGNTGCRVGVDVAKSKTLTSNGSVYTHNSGARVQQFKARDEAARLARCTIAA